MPVIIVSLAVAVWAGIFYALANYAALQSLAIVGRALAGAL